MSNDQPMRPMQQVSEEMQQISDEAGSETVEFAGATVRVYLSPRDGALILDVETPSHDDQPDSTYVEPGTHVPHVRVWINESEFDLDAPDSLEHLTLTGYDLKEHMSYQHGHGMVKVERILDQDALVVTHLEEHREAGNEEHPHDTSTSWTPPMSEEQG